MRTTELPELPITTISKLTDGEFRLLRDLIFTHSGICLNDSKRTMVVSRLQRRLRQLGLSSFSEYNELLTRRDPKGTELRVMLNAITTNKTSFFREEHHFEILSGLLRTALSARQTEFRIWSAASSSGEEPYSIAITAVETLGPGSPLKVRILATDIDTDVLTKAEAGVYPAEAVRTLPERLLPRYFLRGKGASSGSVAVKPEIRRMITFRQLNLIQPHWPMRRQFDAIFCRNVIIYFDLPTKTQVVERMAHLLVDGGHLFLGHSETLNWDRKLVEPVGQTTYRRVAR